MKSRQNHLLSLIIILILGISGCVGNQTPYSNQTTATSSTETLHALATVTVEPSPSAALKPPTVIAPSKTPNNITSTAAYTSIPTLNSEERQIFLEQQISQYNDCELPCWLGITPGKTSWLDALNYLEYLGISKISLVNTTNNSNVYTLGGFDFRNPEIYHRFSIVEQNQQVQGISLIVEAYKSPEEFHNIWKLYSPKNIMERYGAPSRVWLSTTSETMGDRHSYFLIIAFDESGILLRYDGFLTKTDDTFKICPRFVKGMDIQYMEVFLQASGDSTPLENIGGILDRKSIFNRSKRIGEATGLSEEQFYDLFTQNEDVACFYSPVDIWPAFYNGYRCNSYIRDYLWENTTGYRFFNGR